MPEIRDMSPYETSFLRALRPSVFFAVTRCSGIDGRFRIAAAYVVWVSFVATLTAFCFVCPFVGTLALLGRLCQN
jgi:hypothetical protein